MKYNEQNKPIECIMTNSRVFKESYSMEVKGILIHDTAAKNPKISRYVQPSDNDPNRDSLYKIIGVNPNKNSINQKSTSTGVNAYIGYLADGTTVGTVQALPWNMRPWGCGSGSKGSCNNGWIQAEICDNCSFCKSPWEYDFDVNGPLNDYFNKIYKETCEWIAYMCKMFNLDPNGEVDYNGIKVPVITCHGEAHALKLGSGHQDVLTWFAHYGKNMATIRKDVTNILNEKSISIDKKPQEELKVRYFKLIDNMNMRESVPNGKVIQTIKKGTVISGKELVSSGTVKWLNTTYNGKTGYVAVLPESKKYAIEVEEPKNNVEYFPRYAGNSVSIVDALCAVGAIASYSNRQSIAKLNDITGYSGTAEQNKKMLTLLKEGKLIKSITIATADSMNPITINPQADNKIVEYYPMYKGTSCSIVDGLVAVGVDSSYSNRSKIAKANNIALYVGTGSQNKKMLELLKAGKLIKC